MELGAWPLLDRLKSARHVLLAGAGGGYDVFAAVPLLTALRARGQQVSLANLSFTNLAEVQETEAYRDAVEHLMANGRYSSSIVNLSIVSAIDGDFGDVHRTQRTSQSELFINPLMALCWGFELDAVARRCLYLPELIGTQTAFDVTLKIEAFRERTKARAWKELPV